MKTPPWNERTELDFVIRRLFTKDTEKEENFISLDTVNNLLHIKIFRHWVYDRGGWITVEWDLKHEFLHEQKQEVQDEIKKYLFSTKEIKTE